MILECPACHAQFNVPDGAIPPQGRTVRCSACKHQWHATIAAAPEPTALQADTSFLEQLTRATEESSQEETSTPPPMPPTDPVIPEHVIHQSFAPPPPKPAQSFKFPLPLAPFKWAAPLLAVVWFIVALYAYFPSWAKIPGVAGIYGMMGVVPTDGVVLSDIAMQREEEGQRTRFLISGNIVNHEATQRHAPIVRIQMLSKDNEIVWAREYEVNKTLEPGEIYPFRITNAETSFAHNVSQLVVDVGHPLQMMFR
jgi:predicted Zn finger-like uncharacterized protein